MEGSIFFLALLVYWNEKGKILKNKQLGQCTRKAAKPLLRLVLLRSNYVYYYYYSHGERVFCWHHCCPGDNQLGVPFRTLWIAHWSGTHFIYLGLLVFELSGAHGILQQQQVSNTRRPIVSPYSKLVSHHSPIMYHIPAETTFLCYQ